MRLASILIPILAAGISQAPAYANDCDTLCNMNNDTAKSLITDPTCKSKDSCVSCVAQALMNSQSGYYCAAYQQNTKGKPIEIATASLYGLADVACIGACAATMNIVTGSASTLFNKACAYAGLGVSAYEIGKTIVDLTKGESDFMGIASNAVTVGTSVSNGVSVIKAAKAAKTATTGAVTAATTATQKTFLQKLTSPACLNAIVFGATFKAKLKGIKGMTASAAGNCSTAQALATTANSAVQSCLASNVSTVTASGSGPGLVAATAGNYIAPSVDHVDRLGATSADQALKSMKGELQELESSGFANVADIAKKIEAGEDADSIIKGSASSLPSDVTNEVLARAKDLEGGRLLASLTSGSADGYAAAGTGDSASPSGGGLSEMGFGQGATPGEGAATLEIDRKPAATEASLADDGDVFHASFGGSIFDIVSTRIQGAKANYAELEPEGRMNRVFNGYSDRAPAAAKTHKNSAN